MRETTHAARAEIIFPSAGIWGRRRAGPGAARDARRESRNARGPTGFGRIAAILTVAGCIAAIALLLFFGVIVDGWGAPLP